MKLLQIGILAVIFLLIGKTGISQTTFVYGYDNAGNRTSRTIILSSIKSAEEIPNFNEATISGDFKSAQEKFDDSIGEVDITLFPNPTLGRIDIKASNLDDNIACEIIVFDAKGSLLLKQAWRNGSTSVDLTNQPQGVYFVKFVAGDQITQWKVIKE